MNKTPTLGDFLRQNCRKVNKEISRIMPASLIICLAMIIASIADLLPYSTGRVLEICLCLLVCAIGPMIVCHYSYDERINQFACLAFIEILFCLIARNKLVQIDIFYMLMPFISLFYFEKKVYLRSLSASFLIMVFIKGIDFLWIYRTKRYDLVTYREGYMTIISLVIEFLVVTVILHFLQNILDGFLRKQLMLEAEINKPVETVAQETDTIELSEYNTKGLFLEINQTIQNVIRNKGKTFVLDVDSELPVQLAGDQSKIRVMMISLLSDIVQFMNPGERIVLEVTYDKGILPKKGQNISLYLRIMCSEDLSRYLNDNIAMNIAVAKSLLARMNGVFLDKTADMQSKGTAYTLCLQQLVVDEETLKEAKRKHRVEQKELLAESRKWTESILLKRHIKILVVDDSQITLKLLDSILKAYGMTPTLVSTSEEAIRLLRQKGFDLALIDHMMPVKGGIQTVKEIRQMKDEYFQTVPLVAMSSNITDDSRQMLYSCGFDYIISKPIKEMEIRQLMIDRKLLA